MDMHPPHGAIELSTSDRRTARAPWRPRLLVVGPLPPPLGGVQLVIDMQRRSLLAQQFDLHLLDTSKHQLRWAVENPTWKTPLYFVRDFTRLVRALARLRPHVVLVHAAPSLSFLRDWVLMATARLGGAKVVCHYHGTVHAKFPSGQTTSGRILGRLLMAAAQRVIVLGPSYQRELGEAWKRQLAWAPNMADIELFQKPPAPPRAPWLKPGQRAVLFVGRLSAPKGIYDLFDAIPHVIERHPDTRFVLVGVAESDAMEPVIRRAAQTRGIAQHLVFLGSLDGHDKSAAFLTSHLLVVPSWTEAFPLVIPEGMAAGLPIVATRVGAIGDFVTDGKDGFLVAPHDPQALADRICRILGNDLLRHRISSRVRARAPREFAIETGCAKVAQVIWSALDRGPGAKPPKSSDLT